MNSIFETPVQDLRRKIERKLIYSKCELHWETPNYFFLRNREDSSVFLDDLHVQERTNPNSFVEKRYMTVKGIGVKVKFIRIINQTRLKVKIDQDERVIENLQFITELQGTDIGKNFETILNSLELAHLVTKVFDL